METAIEMPTCDGCHPSMPLMTCGKPITHLDDHGYVYCATHGNARKSWCRCRKLTPAELKRLARGERIAKY